MAVEPLPLYAAAHQCGRSTDTVQCPPGKVADTFNGDLGRRRSDRVRGFRKWPLCAPYPVIEISVANARKLKSRTGASAVCTSGTCTECWLIRQFSPRPASRRAPAIRFATPGRRDRNVSSGAPDNLNCPPGSRDRSVARRTQQVRCAHSSFRAAAKSPTR